MTLTEARMLKAYAGDPELAALGYGPVNEDGLTLYVTINPSKYADPDLFALAFRGLYIVDYKAAREELNRILDGQRESDIARGDHFGDPSLAIHRGGGKIRGE